METSIETGIAATGTTKSGGQIRSFIVRLLREKKLGAAGAVVVLALLLVGIFADVIAPYGVSAINMKARFADPSAEHLLGADQLGRDLFSRLVFGARISMIVGVGAAALHLVIAVILALLSGYLGGKVDLFIQRLVDAFLTFPPLFIILTVMTLLPQGIVSVIIVIGVWWGIGGSRILRGVVLSAKENMYVEAARSVGCGTWRILWRHILPQLVAPDDRDVLHRLGCSHHYRGGDQFSRIRNSASRAKLGWDAQPGRKKIYVAQPGFGFMARRLFGGCGLFNQYVR